MHTGQWIGVVSGVPRSGTSMMMAMLRAGGLALLTDEIRQADEDNPKGYFEFEKVKKLRDGDCAWLEEAVGKVVKVVSPLLVYLPADRYFRVVFMVRNMDEVLASQRKMLECSGKDVGDDANMKIYFEKHLNEAKAWIDNQLNICVMYVNYRDVLHNTTGVVARLNAFFDRTLAEKDMMEVVDPTLYRQQRQG